VIVKIGLKSGNTLVIDGALSISYVKDTIYVRNKLDEYEIRRDEVTYVGKICQKLK
jgi:hypothetical protein